MGRYDGRIRCLERQVKGGHSSLWQARLAKMSYEELLAVIVEGAVKYGMPKEQAHADPEAASGWLTEYFRAAEEALLEEEREEILTGQGA